MEIKVGQWIMKEGLFVGHFSHPLRVTDVKGARVYFVKIRRSRTGEVEEEPGYCLKRSVRYVVDSEETGLKFWNFVHDVRERERREIREVEKRYTAEIGRATSLTPGLAAYTGK